MLLEKYSSCVWVLKYRESVKQTRLMNEYNWEDAFPAI